MRGKPVSGSSAATSYRFDRSGRWSGGGHAFLRNVEHAEGRHAILRGGDDAVPIIARNLPAGGHIPRGPFVLAPQNAWPWAPTFTGLAELGRLAVLRAASEFFLRRAVGVIRISSAIPAISHTSSPVIHNVLDMGFEEDLIASQSSTVDEAAVGAFVSIGSINSYRNLVTTIDGFQRYRAAGGNRRLWIAGAAGSEGARREVERAAQGTEGVTIRWKAFERADCLAALRAAAAVILPSKVEASPVSALEAAAANPNVVASRIIGHVELLSAYGRVPDNCLFDPASPAHLAELLNIAEANADAGAGLLSECHATLGDPEQREAARIEWGNRVAHWLQTLGPSTSKRNEAA